jgi:predicted HicB family RNase H-like nuclease
MSDDPSTGSGNASPPPDGVPSQRGTGTDGTTQLNVAIPESIHRRLRMRSAATKRPMKELAAEALDAYLPNA